MKRHLEVAVVQNSAGRNAAANLDRIEHMLAGVGGVDLVALPEVFALRGSDTDLREGAEAVGGRLTDWLAERARRAGAWVLGGSIIERDGEQVYNTSVLIGRDGRVASTYRKMHLFEAHLEDGKVVRERDVYAGGREPVLADVEGWRCGMSVCYDLRFPELYRLYSERGAQVLFAPSNFTQRTGRDHWEVLVRARAIENQCFVVAANQCGANPATGIASPGHSPVGGPWGEVLCEAGDDETVLTARLEMSVIEATRHRVPALDHRRIRAGDGRGGAGGTP
ncbi:MAG: carbon-nitrogen hydrolase family protein [Planctomycetota bacterium]|jgi:predicted amidohydrolase